MRRQRAKREIAFVGREQHPLKIAADRVGNLARLQRAQQIGFDANARARAPKASAKPPPTRRRRGREAAADAVKIARILQQSPQQRDLRGERFLAFVRKRLAARARPRGDNRRQIPSARLASRIVGRAQYLPQRPAARRRRSKNPLASAMILHDIDGQENPRLSTRDFARRARVADPQVALAAAQHTDFHIAAALETTRRPLSRSSAGG